MGRNLSKSKAFIYLKINEFSPKTKNQDFKEKAIPTGSCLFLGYRILISNNFKKPDF